MKSPWLVLGVLAVASLSVRSSAQQPPPVNSPGMPTLARMEVVNRGVDQAVPVVVKAGGDVQPVAVMSAPAVTLAANAAVAALRQAWEYRHLSFKSGEDAAPALTRAGGEGWEAVGIAPATGGGFQVLLKRPR